MPHFQSHEFRSPRPRRHSPSWLALVAALILGAALTGRAATLTWTGAGGDGLISTAANWSPQQAPVSGDVLILAGSSSLSPQLTTNLTVGSITFNSTAAAFTLSGTAAYTVNSGGITNNSTATETIATAVNLGAAQTWTANAGTLAVTGVIANSGNLLTIVGTAATSISGALSGAGGLTKIGAGTLTLSGANTYSGTTTLTAGTIVVGSNQALGAGVFTLNGGAIQADASSRALANNITLKVSSTIGGSQNLTFSGMLTQSGGNRTLTVNNTASAIFTGGIRLSEKTTARTLTIAGTGNTIVNSVISNGARAKSGNLIQTGSGTLQLGGSSSNTFVGTVTVNGGTLLLAKTSGLAIPGNLTIGDGTGTDTARLLGSQQISDTGAVTINAGGVFDVGGFAETIASFSGAGSTVLGSGGLLTVGGGNSSWTFAGSLTGAGGLVKNGTGTLTLTGAANSPGSLTANAGTIAIGAAGAISSATVLGASGAGIVDLGTISTTAGGLNLTGGRVQTSTGTLTLAGDAVATSSGGTAAVVAGKLALSGTRTFTVNAGGATSDLTLSAIVSGSGSLTKAGGGVLLLSAANTYGGATTINAGTLRLSGGAAIADASAVTFANAGGAVLDLAGSSETIGSLAGGGALGGNITLGSGTLTSGGNNTSTTYSGAISGSGGIAKMGSGTLTFAGTNSFTGSAAINAGILRLSGGAALSGSTAVTLANVAGAALDLAGSSAAIGSLSGGGALGGNVTLGSGTLTIGASNASTSFAGIISGTGGGITKTGTGTFTLTGANSFTGAVRGAGGTLALSGGGSATSTTSLTLDSGATLTLDNSGTNNGNRIGDAAAIILNGGTVRFVSGSAGSSETAGALHLASGNSDITLVHNGTGSNSTVLTFSSLGSLAPGATVNFTATGGTLGAAATGPQLYIAGLATGFIGGWATVGTDFAEYSTFGVRALTGYYTGSLGINVNDAAQLPLLTSTSPASAYTLTNAGTTTDKGLSVTDRSLVDLGTLATNTLNLDTGGLLKSTATATTISGLGRLTAGGVATGSLAVTVDTVSTLTISSNIINNAGANGVYGDGDDGVVSLSKGGGGVLVLSGANSYSGSNSINSGTVSISAENNLGAAGNGVTFNGGTLQVTGGFTASAAKVFSVGAGLSGTLDIASGQTLTLAPAANALTSGNSASQLRKTGTGTLVIPGSSAAFTGTLQLDAGTLELRAATALGGSLQINGGALALRADADATFAGAVVLAADATIDVARISGSTPVVHSLGALSIGAKTLTVTGANASLAFGATTLTGSATFNPTTADLTLGAVSGAFGLTKSGAGVLTLAGASTYSGATNVTAGTLRVGAANATSPNSAVLSLASGAVLDLNGFTASVASLTGAGTVTLGAGALTAGADNSSGTFSGVIGGSGAVTKTGSGTLTLSGANTHTGGTVIAGGTLRIGAAERLADGGALTVAGGATFDLNNFNETIASITGAGSVALGSATLTIGGGGAGNFSGILGGTGGLIRAGAGTLALSGANTFSGAASVTGGALTVQNASALGAVTAGTGIGAGGELRLEGDVSFDPEPLTLAGTGVAGAGALRNISGSNAWNGSISATSPATIGVSAGVLTLNGTLGAGAGALTVAGAGTLDVEGVLSGLGGLVKNDSGTLILGVANTYSGQTLVTEGVLLIFDGASLGAGGASDGTTVSAGASLRIEDVAGLTIAERLGLSGGGLGGTGALLSLLGTNVWTGAVTLLADATIGVSSDSLTISGAIGESGGARALTTSGAGTLTLSGANTFTGPTTVAEGTLTLAATASLLSTNVVIAPGATLSVAAGAGFPSVAAVVLGGSLDFNAATQTLATIDGAATGVLTLNTTALSVGAGNFAGMIRNGAGAGSLNKVSAGTLALGGANTFTGATGVQAGTLLVSGSLSGAVIIESGGTLDGSGSVGNVTAKSGATLQAGAGIGIFSTGNLTLQSGSALRLEIAGTGYDQLGVAGSVSLAGALNVSLTGGFTPIGGQRFFLVLNDGADAITGTFAGLPQDVVTTFDGYGFIVGYTGDSAGGTFTGGNDAVLQAVPEPGSAALALAACAALAARARPRRRSGRAG